MKCAAEMRKAKKLEAFCNNLRPRTGPQGDGRESCLYYADGAAGSAASGKCELARRRLAIARLSIAKWNRWRAFRRGPMDKV